MGGHNYVKRDTKKESEKGEEGRHVKIVALLTSTIDSRAAYTLAGRPRSGPTSATATAPCPRWPQLLFLLM